jgi:hypothetical protein
MIDGQVWAVTLASNPAVFSDEVSRLVAFRATLDMHVQASVWSFKARWASDDCLRCHDVAISLGASLRSSCL